MAATSVYRRPNLVPIALALAPAALTALVFFAAPGDLHERLMLALRGVCAQRPDHSFLFDGRPVALEARMFGIFVGFAMAVAVPWVAGRWRRSELPRGGIAAVLLLFVGALAVDGANAVAAGWFGAGLYAPRNDLRLATGLLGGIGVAAYVAPVVSFVFWRRRDPQPLVATWMDLAALLAAAGLAGVMLATGAPGALLLSIPAAAAVVSSLWLVSAYTWVVLWEGPGRAETWSDLAWPIGIGFILAMAELVGLALLRGWMENTIGVTWVF